MIINVDIEKAVSGHFEILNMSGQIKRGVWGQRERCDVEIQN